MNFKLKLLYIGYLGFNNVGDEVCYESFIQSINRWSNSVEKVIAYDIKENKGIKDIQSKESIDAVILGGGSLFQGDIFLTLAEEAIELELPLYSYGTGIDYLTEETLSKYINGESFEPPSFFDNRKINAHRIKKVIESITYTGIRGPLTLHFIKSLTPIKSSIEIIGDSGFIYSPDSDHYIMNHYLFPIQGPLIAINWGTTFNKLFGYNEALVEDQLVESCYYLISKGYHIVIYPMWDQDIESCRNLYHRLNNKDRVTFIPEVCSSSQIFSFLGKCHFSINLKLHANILSAAAFTPFIQLAYRSKGFDFALSVNQVETTLYTHSSNLLESIKEKEENFTHYRENYIDTLKAEKQKYTEKHKRFIESYF
ncbi:polysaccharide pyruvyl transferase family protein [Metabacillus sp. B2-18]|uniref:polysaccharide pyruvyl transferase family protein n=1 Tax=Metabacillus sp. B2-18 TaxID=2897333 RepID=UPI001E523953|nr:polysaccharide pyruvyl transferase family protein [Metabacillus sp. B2-18]UGB28720.1 polysaccharide pyruvyl transferase family protein [Metabacillus sp. B2-18]